MNTSRLVRLFAGGLPDYACYRMDLSANLPGLGGDTDCMVRGMPGNTNGDHRTNLIDMSHVKSMSGSDPAVPGNAKFGLNLDGKINLIDMSAAKNMSCPPLTCP